MKRWSTAGQGDNFGEVAEITDDAPATWRSWPAGALFSNMWQMHWRLSENTEEEVVHKAGRLHVITTKARVLA